MVEFLLSGFFLFTTIFGILQMIIFIYTYVSVAEAAKTGVRYAVVHGGKNSTYADVAARQTAIQNVVKVWANYPSITITVTYPDGNNPNPPNRVRVVVSAPFSSLLPGLSLPNVQSAAEGRIAY
jgi:Flp pilus assembly protein TadG